jgi:hypothetical protein
MCVRCLGIENIEQLSIFDHVTSSRPTRSCHASRICPLYASPPPPPLPPLPLNRFLVLFHSIPSFITPQTLLPKTHESPTLRRPTPQVYTTTIAVNPHHARCARHLASRVLVQDHIRFAGHARYCIWAHPGPFLYVLFLLLPWTITLHSPPYYYTLAFAVKRRHPLSPCACCHAHRNESCTFI